MATGEVVGTVAELWRFPVKLMMGEQLPEVEVTERGVLGDRAYALIDTDTGRAWFMEHRIRECMDDSVSASPLGGEGKFVEADETYVGGRASDRAYKAATH